MTAARLSLPAEDATSPAVAVSAKEGRHSLDKPFVATMSKRTVIRLRGKLRVNVCAELTVLDGID